MTKHSASDPTVSAVIVTRNRLDMLRLTLDGILNSTYPVCEIIVSDDGIDDTTSTMLTAEYPSVTWVAGPRRGLAANRNNGVRASHGDYILLTDDDVVVDPKFIEDALYSSEATEDALFFAATKEFGNIVMPNATDFFGISTIPYKPGDRYTSANQHCFLISRTIASSIQYDEFISVYGYEEWDYAYRVATQRFTIRFVPNRVNNHLDPKTGAAGRPEQEAARLYVTYKRHRDIDRRPLKGLAFLLLAIPRHFLWAVKRFGINGIAIASSNVKLAAQMHRNFIAARYVSK